MLSRAETCNHKQAESALPIANRVAHSPDFTIDALRFPGTVLVEATRETVYAALRWLVFQLTAVDKRFVTSRIGEITEHEGQIWTALMNDGRHSSLIEHYSLIKSLSFLSAFPEHRCLKGVVGGKAGDGEPARPSRNRL